MERDADTQGFKKNEADWRGSLFEPLIFGLAFPELSCFRCAATLCDLCIPHLYALRCPTVRLLEGKKCFCPDLIVTEPYAYRSTLLLSHHQPPRENRSSPWYTEVRSLLDNKRVCALPPIVVEFKNKEILADMCVH